MKSHICSLIAIALVFSCACIRFHRVPAETDLGNHHVTVRPNCQNASTTSLHDSETDGSSTIRYHEFKCGDTTILIRGNLLSVNGRSYGTLNERDKIAVDYGKVRVNSEVREEVR